jgi:hypothetical protein
VISNLRRLVAIAVAAIVVVATLGRVRVNASGSPTAAEDGDARAAVTRSVE